MFLGQSFFISLFSSIPIDSLLIDVERSNIERSIYRDRYRARANSILGSNFSIISASDEVLTSGIALLEGNPYRSRFVSLKVRTIDRSFRRNKPPRWQSVRRRIFRVRRRSLGLTDNIRLQTREY